MDQVIDGFEYQLCKRTKVIEAFERVGLSLENVDKINFKELIPPILSDFIEVNRLIEIFLFLGINEKLPKNRSFVEYSKLNGAQVRLINKINNCLKRDNQTLMDFLGAENTQKYQIICKGRTHNVDVVSIKTLTKLLADKKIIEYATDLDDRFTDLIEVSQSLDDMASIQKFEHILNDMRDCDYFLRFGVNKRNGNAKSAIRHMKTQALKKHSLDAQILPKPPQKEITPDEIQRISESQDKQRVVKTIIHMWKQNHVYGTMKRVCVLNDLIYTL